jgi:hypothetical protein
MNIENIDPLDGDEEDDLANADRGDNLPGSDPAPAADPPPAEPASDPAADAEGGSPAGGDPVVYTDEEEKSIPYHRFKEVNEAKKLLQAQLDEIKANMPQPAAPAAPSEPPADPLVALDAQLGDLYEKVENLRLEGETKEAAAVQRQIDGINQEILLEKSRRIATQTNSVSKVAEQYNNYLDALEGAFPELVKGTDEFDPVKVEDINMTAGAYEKAGMHPLDAIKKATKLVLGQTLEDRIASASKPAPAAAPAPAAPKRDLGKSIDAANKQPPDASARGVNRDDTAINPAQLSEEEFDALPMTKQKELRGDYA